MPGARDFLPEHPIALLYFQKFTHVASPERMPSPTDLRSYLTTWANMTFIPSPPMLFLPPTFP